MELIWPRDLGMSMVFSFCFVGGRSVSFFRSPKMVSLYMMVCAASLLVTSTFLSRSLEKSLLEIVAFLG